MEATQPEFPDLEPVFARDHTLTALSSQSSSIKLLGWLGLTGPPLFAHIQFGLKGANYPASEIRGQIVAHCGDGDDDEN